MKDIGALNRIAGIYADKYMKNPEMKYDFMTGYNQEARENYIIFSLAAVYERVNLGVISRKYALQCQKQIFYVAATFKMEDSDG